MNRRLSKSVMIVGLWIFLLAGGCARLKLAEREADPSMLREAAESGDTAEVERLIRAGVDLDASDDDSPPALFCAAVAAHVEVMQLLCRAGADINVRTRSGNSGLMEALAAGHVHAAELLIDHGIDLTTRNILGQDALMYASQFGHAGIVELLLERGADVNARTNDGVTALLFAVQFARLDIAKLLIENGAPVDVTNAMDQTALMAACLNGDTQMAALLLEASADANARDGDGGTALMYASYNGHPETVELLIENGANLDAPDDLGFTALLYAAEQGHMGIVTILTEAGADIDARDELGDTALLRAVKRGDKDTAEALMDAGALLPEHGILLPWRTGAEFFGHVDHVDVQIDVDPAFDQRPEVPPGVTYRTVDGAVTDEAVRKVRDFYLHGDSVDLLFGSYVICGPYLTRVLATNAAFTALEYLPVDVWVPNVGVLHQRAFRTEETVSAFAHYLRNALNAEGGIVIRRPSARELAGYWAIISYDIMEPVLVLQTASHAVFLDIHEGEVVFADDFAYAE